MNRRALLIVVGLLALGVPARAAQVDRPAGGTIFYRGDGAENNGLVVEPAGSSYTFTDSADSALSGFGSCSSASPGVPASCPAGGVTALQVQLGEGDDTMSVRDPAPPAPAFGWPPIVVDGGDGTDDVTSGSGADALAGGVGNDTLRGAGGDDRLDFAIATIQADEGTGADTLEGGPGNDALNGGPAASASDADTLSGGDGVDTADFGLRTSPVTISLDDAGGDGQPGENDNVRADVENVIAGSADDVITGSAAANLLDGRLGNDTLHGGDGDDTLEGGVNDPGDDTLAGDGGSDTLLGRAGDDTLDGGSGNDPLLSGEGGTDTIRGGDGDDTLDGGPGFDTLEGGPGRDVLKGADGDDRLNGGLGPDELRGGQGIDSVTYNDRSSPVTATLDGKADDGTQGEGDNLAPDIENVSGGTRDDTLRGDGDGNELAGASGEDLLEGKAGVDTLDGGGAPDLLLARDGVDDAIECGAGTDLVIADSGDKVPASCETVDKPGARPKLGTAARIQRATSALTVRLPGGHRFFSGLPSHTLVPIGSAIDPRLGTVVVATAGNTAGSRQDVTVSEGAFTIQQRGRAKPVTELGLVAGTPRSCAKGSRRARAARLPTDPPGRLRTTIGKKHTGAFRVVGKYSLGAASGTSWTTVETCAGTRTIVRSGTVRVTPCGGTKSVEVRAGHRYVAKKKRCRP